jgi:5'(3')-deoxyribonucleotidase
MNVADIEKEMKTLTEKLNTLEKKLPLYKECETVVCSENKLKVKICSVKYDEKDGWIYSVLYPHLKDAKEFSLKEDEIEKMPDDYDTYIFNAYIDLYLKYNDLIERLKERY